MKTIDASKHCMGEVVITAACSLSLLCYRTYSDQSKSVLLTYPPSNPPPVVLFVGNAPLGNTEHRVEWREASVSSVCKLLKLLAFERASISRRLIGDSDELFHKKSIEEWVI